MTRVEVLVVGAGFGGLAAAMALHHAGIDDVVIVERAPRLGGTWRDNTYPGVACDVPSHLYGFAAHPNPDWSGLYAPGAEIRAYLERVAAAERLHPQFDSPMTGAVWDAATERWRVEIGGGDPRTIEAAALVLACGRLTEPALPAVPGLGAFEGPAFHTARWNHDVDLADLRVAVVGTGASAVQVVPELARIARVTLFQRTPAWIVPRGAHAYSIAERDRFAADAQALERLRDELFRDGEERFASRSGASEAADAARRTALAHLAGQVRDDALRQALTPDYAFGCKRVLLSDDFYPALDSGAARLVPAALARIEGRTLVAADGGRHEVDAIVFATGFVSSRQPYAALVRGERDTLDAHWSGGMTSFASTAVSGFPNLFVLGGPNASLGHSSAVLMLEEQAGYVARTLARRAGVLRVRPEAEAAYSAEIDRAAASTPWIAGGCRNWYVDERSGRLTLLWPGTVEAFRERIGRADGSEFLPVTAKRGIA